MDLNTSENIRLLRNCIAIEIKKLQAEEHKTSQEIQAKIDAYSNLFHIITTGDAETIMQSQKGELSDFSRYILSTPPKDILEEYTNITKQAMIDDGSFDKTKFNAFKKAFWNDFSLSKIEDFEEEPEEKIYKYKDLFAKIFKNRPQTANEFQEFSLNFAHIIKSLGINKFQEYFNNKKQTISDMQISYDSPDHSIAGYQADFTLSDITGSQSHFILKEPAPKHIAVSNYIQILCYSYLKAKENSNRDENTIDTQIIKKEMTIFSDCRQKLEEFEKCKINILPNNKLLYYDETEYEPEYEKDDIACNAEIIDNERSL